jgi:hypothetical protein
VLGFWVGQKTGLKKQLSISCRAFGQCLSGKSFPPKRCSYLPNEKGYASALRCSLLRFPEKFYAAFFRRAGRVFLVTPFFNFGLACVCRMSSSRTFIAVVHLVFNFLCIRVRPMFVVSLGRWGTLLPWQYALSSAAGRFAFINLEQIRTRLGQNRRCNSLNRVEFVSYMSRLQLEGSWNELKGKLKQNTLSSPMTTLPLRKAKKMNYWGDFKRNSASASDD